MRISAIVAMASNSVIGQGNQLPWKLPEDLKRFKEVTWGHPILMGRKTFESIGRPLPGRRNLVLSRNSNFQAAGVESVLSLDHALDRCAQTTSEFFVIGGAEIYRLALPRVQRIYLTQIDHEIAGDAFFPEVDWNQFQQVSCEERLEPFKYRFLTLDRK